MPLVFFIWGACSSLGFQPIDGENKETYLKRRTEIVNEELKRMTGGSLSLNKNEQKVNTYLMKLKQAEFEVARGPKGKFWPSEHFFYAKEEIEESPVFKIIQQMPKGEFHI